MKNIILGILGLCIVFYTLLIGINVFTVTTEKNALNIKVSHAVKACMENYYSCESPEIIAREQLETDILLGEEDAYVDIFISEMDLEKGIISVEVEKEIPLVTGEKKKVFVTKTAIMERVNVAEPKVCVVFMIGEKLYKKYEITKGEICPMPKSPSDTFQGWIKAGEESKGIVSEIGKISQDTIYYALGGGGN